MSVELEKLLTLESKVSKLESLLIMGVKDDFTPEEAALFMGLSTDHVYRLTSGESPEIGYSKPNGKNKYILKADCVAYMRKGRKDGALDIDEKVNQYFKKK